MLNSAYWIAAELATAIALCAVVSLILLLVRP
jgi:hypothetical protein